MLCGENPQGRLGNRKRLSLVGVNITTNCFAFSTIIGNGGKYYYKLPCFSDNYSRRG